MNQNYYDDIINCERPEHKNHEKMNLNQRAKIFLPFSALTGFEQALERKLRFMVNQYEENIDWHCQKY